MSADPSIQGDGTVFSAYTVLPISPIYETYGGTKKAELVTHNGLPGDNYFADRKAVPPYSATMAKDHPCISHNDTLKTCSDKLPPKLDLANRTLRCNDQRIQLMKCLVKNKNVPRSSVNAQQHQGNYREPKKKTMKEHVLGSDDSAQVRVGGSLWPSR